MEPFTYRKTPAEVKTYFVELLGAQKAGKLMRAMKRREWIIITGPHIATGKTMLADILKAIGYTHVLEEWETNSIQICDPLKERREKNDILESLGISRKC